VSTKALKALVDWAEREHGYPFAPDAREELRDIIETLTEVAYLPCGTEHNHRIGQPPMERRCPGQVDFNHPCISCGAYMMLEGD
jgi:hypothetical protein